MYYVTTLSLLLPALANAHYLRTYDYENTSVVTEDTSAALSFINKDATNIPAPNPDIFEPAADLDTFRNVDPSKFEWVNPDEIEAGGTTCGFLKAPFGWPAGSETGFKESDDQTEYPLAKVYVCVRFADQQPAPRGNMAIHCGGPGSLSGCIYSTMGDATHDLGYNVIVFDQRGMGRSSPSFFIEECTYYGITDFDSLDVDDEFDSLDVDDEESIREFARLIKARNLGCWNHPSFKVPLDEDDDTDTSKTYHFLEYSGTRQLAEDIERVRILFGDQKLSVYGLSYGTAVMGTYTTIFPDNVNLMVLDSNLVPNYDIVQFSEDAARSTNQRIDYFIASCEFGNDKCGVKDMRACINKLNDIIQDNRDYIQDKYKDDNSNVQPIFKLMLNIIQGLFGNYELTPEICSAAKENDLEQLEKLMDKLVTSPSDLEITFIQDDTRELDSESKPTSGEKPDWPFPRYKEFEDDGVTYLVHSQDMSFGAYDEDMFVRFAQEINKKYPGAGTQGPAKYAVIWYRYGYYWPNTTPLSPMGNPNQKGIVAGQIYDPATPYIWTQRMRENFPSTALLTSRSVNHGLKNAINTMHGKWDGDPVCDGLVHDYFRDGEVGFVDGHVCESDPIGDSCSINDIVDGERGDVCHPPPL